MHGPSSAHPPGGGESRGCVRVVVADDSAGMRALLRAQLGAVDGVRIVGVAADGAEAVEQAVREVPDLVLLDIAMPTMDGLEAAAEIRRRRPEVKIVVLSAFSGERMADPARVAGADAYLEKAAPGDELVALIRRLFPDTRLAETPPAALPVGAVANAAAATTDASFDDPHRAAPHRQPLPGAGRQPARRRRAGRRRRSAVHGRDRDRPARVRLAGRRPPGPHAGGGARGGPGQ